MWTAYHRQPQVWGEALLSQEQGIANQPDRPCPFPRMNERITRPLWPRVSLKPLADLSPPLPSMAHYGFQLTPALASRKLAFCLGSNSGWHREVGEEGGL